MLVAASLFAQTFNVVSIKPNTSGARTSVRLEPGGRFVVTNWSATMLIAWKKLRQHMISAEFRIRHEQHST